jgi:hypothetical protein
MPLWLLSAGQIDDGQAMVSVNLIGASRQERGCRAGRRRGGKPLRSRWKRKRGGFESGKSNFAAAAKGME